MRRAKDHLADADYYPPAARGSFYGIINHGYDTIVLIDGLFYASLSVWHKEIMHALDSGIAVIGASSMGALRAAELQGSGIVGVGTIFDWYRDGVIDGDDEVALLHEGGDQDFAALSVPLVNLRWNLRRAVDQGVIDPRAQALVIDAAKRLCFTERTLPNMFGPLHDQLDVARLEAWLRDHAEDLKRLDAIRALTLAADRSSTPPSKASPVLRPYETFHMNVGIEYYWSERLNSITAQQGDREARLSNYLDHIRPQDPEYRDLLRARSYQKLIAGWARELRLDVAEQAAPADETPPGHDGFDQGRRRATGMTLLDLARDDCDASLVRAMQTLYCGPAAAGLIGEVDRRLRAEAHPTALDWSALAMLDGALVYTLWRLGLEKNLPAALSYEDAATEEPADPAETVEAVMAFARRIDELGPSLFGYSFHAGREILFACQRLDRLDTLAPTPA